MAFFQWIFIFVLISTIDAQCNPTGLKRYGTKCSFRCHCLNNEQCDFETGFCASGCSFEWAGPGCQHKNIAYGTILRHLDNMEQKKFSALANDPDITTCSYTDLASRSRTDAPWLALWLPYYTTFTELDILTKDEFLPYFSGFTVTVQNISKSDHENKKYINGDICYKHENSTPQYKNMHVKCTNRLVGNQIRVQLSSTSTQLVVCDFRVYEECRDRMWGSLCQNECGPCYNLEQCDSTDGHCSKGCEFGYKNTTNCTSGCLDGFYGPDCKTMCSLNCVGKQCDKTFGTCLSGCVAGWKGSLCNEVDTDECSNGYWGKNCQRACGKCASGSCDRFDGTCSGVCQPGYKYKIYCDEECETGWYGNNCSNKCSSDCKDLTFCRKSDGLCVTASSSTKMFVFVGGALALAVLIIAGVISILCLRRHLRNSTPLDNNTHIYLNAGPGYVSTDRDVKSVSETYEGLQTEIEIENEYEVL